MKRILLAAGSEKSIDALSAMINSLADVEIVSSSYADKVKLMLEDAQRPQAAESTDTQTLEGADEQTTGPHASGTDASSITSSASRSGTVSTDASSITSSASRSGTVSTDASSITSSVSRAGTVSADASGTSSSASRSGMVSTDASGTLSSASRSGTVSADASGASSSAAIADASSADADIDLVVINTPLLGSQGLELAAYAAQELMYPVLVLTGEETIKRVGDRLTEKGIVTVSRPIDRKAFAAALTQLLTVSSLIKAVRKRNLDLEEKIEETKLVNRAKALLIKHLKMTEDQAHRYIEKQAMDLRAEKRAVARNIIKTYYNR